MRIWWLDKAWYLAFWIGVLLVTRYWFIPVLAREIGKAISKR